MNRVVTSTPTPVFQVYSRELPVGSQSGRRGARALCGAARTGDDERITCTSHVHVSHKTTQITLILRANIYRSIPRNAAIGSRRRPPPPSPPQAPKCIQRSSPLARIFGLILAAAEAPARCVGLLAQVRVYLSIDSPCKNINRSHTHTHTDRQQHPRHRHTHAHDKNNTPNPQTNTSHKHLTTLEGGARM